MKKIQLTRGFVALVDDADYKAVKAYKWSVHTDKTRPRHIYAVTYKGRKTIRMHRLLMGVDNPKIFVDHRDHDGLNNRRYNLRICTHQQNSANQRSVNADGTIKLKGIRKIKNGFGAAIATKKKAYWLGSFKTIEEAARAYDKKAIELHGEFAYLNYTKP